MQNEILIERTAAIVAGHALYVFIGVVCLGAKTGLTSTFGLRMHLTNWSWALNTFFFGVALMGYAFPLIDIFWAVLVLPAVWATTWTVALLSVVLLAVAPDILTGAGVPMGLALVMDRTLHVLPIIALILYVFARHRSIAHAFQLVAERIGVFDRKAWRLSPWYVAFFLCVQCAGIPLIYVLAVDVNAAYGVDYPRWASGAVVVGIALVMGVALLRYVIFVPQKQTE